MSDKTKDIGKILLDAIPSDEVLKKSVDKWYKKYQICQKKGHIPKKGSSRIDSLRGIVYMECKRCGVAYTRNTTAGEDREDYLNSRIPIRAAV